MSSYNWPPRGSGGGVTSLDGLTGAITLVAGTGITITDNSPVAGDITIASSSAGDVTIGAFSSTPTTTGLTINGSQVLNMDPADGTHPGGVSTTTQTFAGNKTFSGLILAANGSVSAPSVAFSGDTNNGFYYVGTDQWALTAGSNAALEVRKSTGAFANVGMGGSASTSDSYPLLIQRSNTSVGTYAQIANPATDASSKASWQLSTDNGANTGELSVFTAATGTAAYAGSLVLRPSDSTLRLSLIGGDLAGGYVTTYTGGDYTSAGETVRFNADHTSQFMQSVATPTSPAAGLKFYNASGVFTSKTTGGTVSSFTGVNTGDQASGNLTAAGTDGIAVTGGTGAVLGSGTSIAQHVADASHNGYLSSTDWSTFNSKGAGSVTSVGLSVPSSILGVTGTPVTGSGTLGLTTTGTSGGIPYFSSTSALSSSAALAQYSVVLGGGAGATPATLATDASTTKVLTSGGSSANPSWAAVSGNSFATQTANTVLAGPTSGGAAAPTFRALSGADLPGYYYASVYYPGSNSNYWSNTNTSFGDFTVVGTTPTPSVYTNPNFGTISKATSSLPGINFSAPRTGTIKMTVTAEIYPGQAVGNAIWAIKLLESTTSTDMASMVGGVTANGTTALLFPLTLVGYFAATVSTTYNFKLQSQIQSTTFYIGANNVTTASQLTFTVEYIS